MAGSSGATARHEVSRVQTRGRPAGGTGAPHRVDGGVVGDAEQPARQPSRRVERGEAAKGLDERLLCEVLGERPIAGHAGDEADDRPLIPAHDLLEGRLRAGQGLGDDPGLAYGFQIDRDGRSS